MTDLPYHTPLSPDQQRAFGVADPQPLAMADRVRFGELDLLGHVNNAIYMRWFESLRVRYFQDWGISTYRDHASEPRIVIRRGEIDYLAEVRMDQAFVCTAATRRFRTSSFTMWQELWVEGRLSATMASVIVLLSPDGSGRMPIPDAVLHRMRAVDKAAPAISGG
ncbi:thioesterase family protein [Thalassococcus sp. CAU 1522]|uniref:Thioesterase family protein n=1 Tax=Thalassococcus arenae TaxID=2851652 RepID=A0ABS6NAW9_9RHOB|nr:acyl-CoA thioesterase [Thalassococcus arenae]MBV2361162.1 thioesterase family protein [Thalassococcus arenae]